MSGPGRAVPDGREPATLLRGIFHGGQGPPGPVLTWWEGTDRSIATSVFYSGRQVTVIVGAGAGGGYDLQARLMARHLGRHIPGNPTFIVQNMPGAGSLAAANHIFNAAPAAIAFAAGLDRPTVDDWHEVNVRVPRLVSVLPNGPFYHPTIRAFLAGGVPEVMLHLRSLGLLDLSARTVTGMTLEQVKAAKPTLDYDGIYGAATGPWTTDMFIEAVYKSLRKK